MRTEDFSARWENHVPGLMGARHRYAVLFPLLETEDGLQILFERRAAGVSQPGETCFPGGRIEAGESPVDCALRETEEELGIPARELRVLGMSDFICSPRGFLLQPVLAAVSPEALSALAPAPEEVAEVFAVPLSFFLKTKPENYRYVQEPVMQPDFPYESLGIPETYPWARGSVDVPVWQYEGHVIWGMTARILRDILRGMENAEKQ